MEVQQMKTIAYNFAEQFTDCPGGRYEARSEKSGEEFRKAVLLPLIEANEHVTLNLNGVFGFPPSFLDEVFGSLVRKYGKAGLERRLTIVLTDDDVGKRNIEAVYDKHSSDPK
jgi:hypothetical protein